MFDFEALRRKPSSSPAHATRPRHASDGLSHTSSDEGGKRSPSPRDWASGAGHDFGAVRVNASGMDALETPVTGEVPADIDLLQSTPPTATPEAPTDTLEKPSPCCAMDSFTASGDSYVDSDTSTKKDIKFTGKVKSGGDPKKCVMVNWVQGTAKNKDGTYRQAKVFDKVVDINFPTMQIDSVDTDPVYWSDASKRWNYVPVGADGFYATDSPGPSVWADGIDYDLKYKMCLYCIDDVSATSDVSGSGVKNPAKCIDWTFRAKYDAATKKFTH